MIIQSALHALIIFALLMSLELGRDLSDRKRESRLCNRKKQESLLLAMEGAHVRKQRKVKTVQKGWTYRSVCV